MLNGQTEGHPAFAPERIMGLRIAGALPIAAPGTRPVPHGPFVFPWVVLGLAIAYLAWALSMPRAADEANGPA